MAILFIAKTNVYRYIEGTSDTKSSVGHRNYESWEIYYYIIWFFARWANINNSAVDDIKQYLLTKITAKSVFIANRLRSVVGTSAWTVKKSKTLFKSRGKNRPRNQIFATELCPDYE